MQEDKKQKIYHDLDKRRRSAATSRDALSYAIYCNATGISPESEYQDLYNQGIHEKELYPQKASELETIIDYTLYGRPKPVTTDNKSEEVNIYSINKKDMRIIDFLREAKKYNSDIGKDISDKQKLLTQYFARFQKEGSEDLSKKMYRPAQLGAKFQRIVESYEKNIKSKYSSDVLREYNIY